ncbi:MAG: hypothetical protein E7056_09680 [Lentisphaerae bacterium]|nr:hypothetical protein [Lentisphaerota bacterium]
MKMNFYGRELNVYRANLHTHTTTSDGEFTPQETVNAYAAAGYDVLNLSDHWKTNDISQLDPQGMTLLSGIELAPSGPRRIECHILGIDVPYGFPGYYDSVQEGIDSIKSSGGLAFMAHPRFSGLTCTDLLEYDNLLGIEVYNTASRFSGKESSAAVWDELLYFKRDYTALAVDDMHSDTDKFGGWTMICAVDKSRESIVQALRDGCFYATQGPQIYALEYENGIFRAKFDPAVRAMVMADRSLAQCIRVEAAPGMAETPLAESCEINIAKWLAPGQYFRLEIMDERGRFAWSNPIRFKAAE